MRLVRPTQIHRPQKMRITNQRIVKLQQHEIRRVRLSFELLENDLMLRLVNRNEPYYRVKRPIEEFAIQRNELMHKCIQCDIN